MNWFAELCKQPPRVEVTQLWPRWFYEVKVILGPMEIIPGYFVISRRWADNKARRLRRRYTPKDPS